MPEAKDDLKREKVRIVPISNIEDFPDHPFQVKDDESMDQLVESIRMNGVLNPVIALKIDENHYQLISGHRRKRACMLLGIDRIPLIGREMTKEEAVLEMVDSNLQREHILPCALGTCLCRTGSWAGLFRFENARFYERSYIAH